MNDVEGLLRQHGALQSGHFKLSSGRHSDTFVQTALVTMHPAAAAELGDALARATADLEPTVVVGPAVAGIVIGHEVARALGRTMIFPERVGGHMALRRSFTLDPGQRVLIVENVVTTGGSQREVMDLVAAGGATVVGIAAIVDRSGGVDFGVPFRAALELDAPSWDADACPLCSDGQEIVAPGSRHLAR